jgi:hypothetical protein
MYPRTLTQYCVLIQEVFKISLLIFASLESFLHGESLSFEFSRKAYRGVATPCVGLVFATTITGEESTLVVSSMAGESLEGDSDQL